MRIFTRRFWRFFLLILLLPPLLLSVALATLKTEAGRDWLVSSDQPQRPGKARRAGGFALGHAAGFRTGF